MYRPIILLLLTAFAGGSWSSSEVPTFSICNPHHAYSPGFNSLREIDFSNFSLIVFDDRGHESFVAKLRNGLFEHKYSLGSDWVKLTSVKYFDFADGQPRRALLAADYVATGASASDFGVIQVFEVANGHPIVLQQIEFNERGEGVGSSFDVETGTLTIKGVSGWEHCCSTKLDVGTFKWNGSRFVLRMTASALMPAAQ